MLFFKEDDYILKKVQVKYVCNVAAIGHGAHKPETVIEIKKCN